MYTCMTTQITRYMYVYIYIVRDMHVCIYDIYIYTPVYIYIFCARPVTWMDPRVQILFQQDSSHHSAKQRSCNDQVSPAPCLDICLSEPATS